MVRRRKGDAMRSASAQIRLATSALILVFGVIGEPAALAQTQVDSLDDLRRELAAGDFITITPKTGPPIEGRLIRFGNEDLDVRLVQKRTPPGSPRDVTIALKTIRSLQRPPDSTRNGTLVGAGIGAGVGGAMFVTAMAIDANEMDEWAPIYLGFTAISTGVGALIGWVIDHATSKPHIRFDAVAKAGRKVRVDPAILPGRGIALMVTISP
jgi:hypothetical protein